MLYLASFFAPEIQSHLIVWRLYVPPRLQKCIHLYTGFLVKKKKNRERESERLRAASFISSHYKAPLPIPTLAPGPPPSPYSTQFARLLFLPNESLMWES